jgi:hypothetical protein
MLAVARGFVARERTDFLESELGAIPRGALTEISGPASSGRTTFLHSLLAKMTFNDEFCALIDVNNTFDPASAAGIRLSQLLWVRCGGNVDNAIRAADLLAQAGGFGLVAIDLGETPFKIVHRLPLAVWFRLRHAVTNTKTALVSLAERVHAHSCSELKIQLSRDRVVWRGKILQGIDVTAQCVKNHRAQEKHLYVRLHSCSR